MIRRLQALFALLCTAAALTTAAVAGPAVLVDATSGRLLYAEDQDDQWYPASLTKIMTAYVAFEAIKAGKLTLATKIAASELAVNQPPSKVGFPVGGEITVELALQALIVKSANDVAVMLAEAIEASEAAFVERMNKTARRLGMTRTRFTNPNGLPHPEQVTTARDLARLSLAVIRDFPQYAPYWTMSEMQIGPLKLISHNGLLKHYEGADGLKTGFICDAGYNVVSTASRDGKRLIAVVLGAETAGERNERAAALLDHGFLVRDWKAALAPRETLDALPLAAAKPAASMRAQVYNFDCGNRRRPIQRTAKAKSKGPKQVQGEASPPAAQSAARPSKAAVAVPVQAPPAPKAQ